MWTGRLASPRGFEKYKFSGPIPNPLNQNLVGWGFRNWCVKTLSGRFLHTLEIKNNCFISFDKSKLPFWCIWFKSWHLRLHSQKHRKIKHPVMNIWYSEALFTSRTTNPSAKSLKFVNKTWAHYTLKYSTLESMMFIGFGNINYVTKTFSSL